MYHTELGQNTVFHNSSGQIALSQCPGRSMVLAKLSHTASRLSFLVLAVSVVECLNEL